jgi:hypothetical protein
MKRLLICGRLDGEPHSLLSLEELCSRENPDALLISGLWQGSHRLDRKMSVDQRDFYRQLFAAIKRTQVPAMILPGEHDVPLADFFRVVLMEEVDNPRLHCVHAKAHVEQNVLVAGVGGDLSEVIDTWNDRLRCSRSSAEYFLRGLACANVPYTVLMLTTPIAGPIGSHLHTRIAGDPDLAGELINSTHPVMAVVAGETSCRGSKRIANTRVINPGRLSEGSAAIADLRDLDAVYFTTVDESHLVA